MKRIPMKTADEYDALTRWRHFLHWRAGERKRIKRGYNRRERRTTKEWIKSHSKEVDELS